MDAHLPALQVVLPLIAAPRETSRASSRSTSTADATGPRTRTSTRS